MTLRMDGEVGGLIRLREGRIKKEKKLNSTKERELVLKVELTGILGSGRGEEPPSGVRKTSSEEWLSEMSTLKMMLQSISISWTSSS